MPIERVRVVIFLICLSTFGLACLGVGLALGKEYATEVEAAFIKPDRPGKRDPQTCNDRPKVVPAKWRIQDEDGNVIEAETIFIRRMC